MLKDDEKDILQLDFEPWLLGISSVLIGVCSLRLCRRTKDGQRSLGLHELPADGDEPEKRAMREGSSQNRTDDSKT
jgi:hypothetical protein